MLAGHENVPLVDKMSHIRHDELLLTLAFKVKVFFSELSWPF